LLHLERRHSTVPAQNIILYYDRAFTIQVKEYIEDLAQINQEIRRQDAQLASLYDSSTTTADRGRGTSD
jgi:hypothetical protein